MKLKRKKSKNETSITITNIFFESRHRDQPFQHSVESITNFRANMKESNGIIMLVLTNNYDELKPLSLTIIKNANA